MHADSPSAIKVNPWRSLQPAVIILLGFGLRLYRINQESVGYDEAFSLTASQLPLNEMIRGLVADIVHPPLHYFALRGWFALVGFGVFQARLLSAIMSTLALVVLYRFAKYLFDRRTALLATLLLAVSQLTIWFAQEPRPYAQLLLLSLVCSYSFVRALREQRTAYWWVSVGATVLMIYTHYFGVLVVAALLLYAGIYRRRYRLRLWWALGGATAVVVCFSPWLATGIATVALHAPKLRSGINPYWAVNRSTFFSAVNSFNNGKPYGYPAAAPLWAIAVGGMLFGAPLLIAARKLVIPWARLGLRERIERESVVIAGILGFVPILLALGLGATMHIQYNVRYIAFAAAPYYILVARGLSELRPSVLRGSLVVLIMVYSANALRANYFRQWKENFRDAFSYVDRHRQQGDCGVFLPRIANTPQQWTITQADRPSFRVIQLDSPTDVPSCDRIWAVSWSLWNGPWAWRLAARDKSALEIAHQIVTEQRYFGVNVDLYLRKTAPQ